MTDLVHLPKPEPMAGFGVSALFIGAIALGAVVGLSDPALGTALSQGIDPTLLAIVGLLFFEVRLRAVTAALANLKLIGLAWAVNFLVVPLVGFAIASLFLSGQPLLFTGLLIYFLAPCTDWFLAFTRMARGDTALGAALIPINLLTQLLLFPVWLWLF
ncbi:MAG: bile acid:sodium symporter, partial [Pseudomonadota bacterium]